MPETNAYSEKWFKFFHVSIGEERTAREVEFVCSEAPLPEFRRVLDVCCGMGRHARALSAREYAVTGIDRDARAIARARELGGGPTYRESDVRSYRPEDNAYDIAIVMSQSFGHFDSVTNHKILSSIASGLRKGGRLILDLWEPNFFSAHQGERDLETSAGIVREKKSVHDGRLFVRLNYPDGAMENFEWELFTPTRMRALAERVGLVLVTACTNFDADTEPNTANPRIQFVLEKM